MPKVNTKEKKLAIFGGNPIFKKRVFFPFSIGKEETKAVSKVLKSSILSQSRRGYYVKLFEDRFAHYFGRKYAITTTSGTTALHVAICALDISLGDEVLVPALTFISTASVVMQERAKPVVVDIDKDTFNMDVKDLARKITKKTKAIIIVHLYGNPANMEEVVKIAKKHKLRIIEDCAQAPGASYLGKYIGTFGDIACFSFQQTKNMTCGEGGMIMTDSKELYKKCVSVVDHGIIDGNLQGYNYDRLGYNYHMTEMQAAIGIEQLKKIKSMNCRRIIIAKLYKKYLNNSGLFFQKVTNKSQSVYYYLTALLPEKFIDKRDWFVEAVRAENAEILKLYPLSLPQTRIFSDPTVGCDIAKNITARLFNLTTNPNVSAEYILKTCQAIRKVLNYLNKIK